MKTIKEMNIVFIERKAYSFPSKVDYFTTNSLDQKIEAHKP